MSDVVLKPRYYGRPDGTTMPRPMAGVLSGLVIGAVANAAIEAIPATRRDARWKDGLTAALGSTYGVINLPSVAGSGGVLGTLAARAVLNALAVNRRWNPNMSIDVDTDEPEPSDEARRAAAREWRARGPYRATGYPRLGLDERVIDPEDDGPIAPSSTTTTGAKQAAASPGRRGDRAVRPLDIAAEAGDPLADRALALGAFDAMARLAEAEKRVNPSAETRRHTAAARAQLWRDEHDRVSRSMKRTKEWMALVSVELRGTWSALATRDNALDLRPRYSDGGGSTKLTTENRSGE